MYICVCNAVTEADIKQAVYDGANCLNHLETKLGVSNQCGSCACDASACLNRVMESQMHSADPFSI
jgi:bacterioferritin-associated ferredoxin